jgi:hypothetical protein
VLARSGPTISSTAWSAQATMPNAASVRTHTPQVVSAYREPPQTISPWWRLLVAGLLLTGLLSLPFGRVCTPEAPGTIEWMRGVRHEKRGNVWYHCEPWIRRVLRD